MNLRILLPTRILIDRPVDKVITEAENGSFCLLPRHIDFVAALVPGLLSFMADQEEQFVAIDEGVLVKNGANVLVSVRDAVIDTNARYPFLAYGTDWLAFSHLVIAVAFIGPLRDPVRNIWVIDFGLIACVGVIPMALIAGHIRAIPLWWQLIDCSFGIFGAIPLLLVRQWIRALATCEAR